MAIPADAPDALCPGCLFDGALADEPPPEVTGRVGDYELLERIARGGMGVVYRARSPRAERVVALKMVLAGAHASDAQLRRFREEATAAARLEHPNIVPVYEVGEHDGLPFFTMRLMEHGSLAAQANGFREPRQAATLVATLARAVHHGHQRGVIHRDLKPENVLFDAEDRPHVADFGVAKRLAVADTASGAIVGTPGYMAPEQLDGKHEVTTAADVYGLGAILYWALTGRPPFVGASALETLRAIADAEPSPIHTLAPTVDRDLQAICLKALERDPARRYPSASALAAELERFVAGEPVLARPPSVTRRVVSAAKRHLAVTGLLGFATLAGIALTGSAFGVARSQEAELRADVLRVNEYTAGALAGLVLAQFRDAAASLKQAAGDQRLAEAFEGGDGSAALAAVITQYGLPAFDSWLLVGPNGEQVARLPQPPAESPAQAEARRLQHALAQRDYVVAIRARADRGVREPYVSKAFKSAYDGSSRVAFAAPVFSADGTWRGTLVATLTTDAAPAQLLLYGDERHSAVLVAPVETGGFIALIHGSLKHGEPLRIDAPEVVQLGARADPNHQLELSRTATTRSSDAHHDPTSGDARWLAGFAPVGATGYVVIVQTRIEDAVAPSRTVARGLALGFAVPLIAVVLVALIAGRRRAR